MQASPASSFGYTRSYHSSLVCLRNVINWSCICIASWHTHNSWGLTIFSRQESQYGACIGRGLRARNAWMWMIAWMLKTLELIMRFWQDSRILSIRCTCAYFQSYRGWYLMDNRMFKIMEKKIRPRGGEGSCRFTWSQQNWKFGMLEPSLERKWGGRADWAFGGQCGASTARTNPAICREAELGTPYILIYHM